MGLNVRNTVFAICEKIIHKSACSATETNQNIIISYLMESAVIILEITYHDGSYSQGHFNSQYCVKYKCWICDLYSGSCSTF